MDVAMINRLTPTCVPQCFGDLHACMTPPGLQSQRGHNLLAIVFLNDIVKRESEKYRGVSQQYFLM